MMMVVFLWLVWLFSSLACECQARMCWLLYQSLLSGKGLCLPVSWIPNFTRLLRCCLPFAPPPPCAPLLRISFLFPLSVNRKRPFHILNVLNPAGNFAHQCRTRLSTTISSPTKERARGYESWIMVCCAIHLDKRVRASYAPVPFLLIFLSFSCVELC